VGVLAERADEVLLGPKETLGPPWTKDHRMALAATIVAESKSAKGGKARAPSRPDASATVTCRRRTRGVRRSVWSGRRRGRRECRRRRSDRRRDRRRGRGRW